MKFSSSSLGTRKKSALLVIPFWQTKKNPEAAAALGTVSQELKAAGLFSDFGGKCGETRLIYPKSQSKEARMLLLGLGKEEECSVEQLRRAYCEVVKEMHGLELVAASLLLPEKGGSPDEIARGASEGLLLANYSFDYKKQKKSLVKEITFLTANKNVVKLARERGKMMEGVRLARDLCNGNADEVTPQKLVATARSLSKKYSKVKATILNKSRLTKEKFGLLLAVNRGSAREPALIILQYKGDPKSKENTVVVGKGVTYDSGGHNLKPTGGIETMRCDMGGAATALGTMQAVAAMGLKTNVTVVVPTTENMLDANSYKAGDVYTAYDGTSVHIGNTDAEGRLILADALAYTVKKLKPTRIIDFATLTGAMLICLGAEATGLMSNNDKLAQQLMAAGEDSYERTWRLPLFEEYKAQLKSDIADLSNIGGRTAGSITAGLFLQHFVGDVPWAHCDIAGTAFLDKPRRYHPKNGTGVGVRLMVSFLQSGH